MKKYLKFIYLSLLIIGFSITYTHKNLIIENISIIESSLTTSLIKFLPIDNNFWRDKSFEVYNSDLIVDSYDSLLIKKNDEHIGYAIFSKICKKNDVVISNLYFSRDESFNKKQITVFNKSTLLPKSFLESDNNFECDGNCEDCFFNFNERPTYTFKSGLEINSFINLINTFDLNSEYEENFHVYNSSINNYQNISLQVFGTYCINIGKQSYNTYKLVIKDFTHLMYFYIDTSDRNIRKIEYPELQITLENVS